MLTEISYYPFWSTNNMRITIVTTTYFYSFLVSYLSFVPFLVVNRFWITATYCSVSVITKCVSQVSLNQYFDFYVCKRELFAWYRKDIKDASQTCKDKYQLYSRDDLTDDFLDELDEQFDKVRDLFNLIKKIDNIINMVCLIILILEIVYRKYRNREACFK